MAETNFDKPVGTEIAELNSQITQYGNFDEIKNNITTDGTVSFNSSQYRFIMFALFSGTQVRSTTILPVSMVGSMGLDVMINTTRCYLLVTNYSSNTITYSANINGLAYTSFRIYGIK